MRKFTDFSANFDRLKTDILFSVKKVTELDPCGKGTSIQWEYANAFRLKNRLNIGSIRDLASVDGQQIAKTTFSLLVAMDFTETLTN